MSDAVFRRARLLRSLALAAALLLASSDAHAANPCEDGGSETLPGNGIGGTGRAPGDGIGGTGRSDDDGIGGTGRDGGDGIGGTGRGPKDPGEGGIGGTGHAGATRGIFGTVTGYASLCVAGLEVDYDAAALGLAAAPPIGETVEIVATGDSDKLRAQSLTSRPAVVGPVEAIDREAGTMRVLGQDVVFDASTRTGRTAGDDTAVLESTIARGESVRVSGLRRADGRIVASRIDPSAGDAALVSGRVSGSGDGWAEVGALRVDTAALRGSGAPSAAAPLRRGDDVLLSGRFDAGRFVATRAERPLALLDAPSVERIDIEAFVGDDGRTVTVDGRRLEVPRGTAGGRGLFRARRDSGGALIFERMRPPVAWHRPGQPPAAGAGAPPPPAGHAGHLRPQRPDRLDRPERPPFPDRPPPRPPRPPDGPPPPPPPPPPLPPPVARPERPARVEFPR